MSRPAEYFDAKFRHTPDPWGFRHRWYEKRKRELTLATLPRQHYRCIFEAGCANGELSHALAPRCAQLLGCDLSPTAVALAQDRLRDMPHAEVYVGALPADWPTGTFDLIVLSEIGYYLDEPGLHALIQHCLASLTDDGAVLACHWQHPIDDGPLTGHQVHRLLRRYLPLRRVVCHREQDFVLELWSKESGTVNVNEAAR